MTRGLLLDTGIWIRALGQRHDEPADACRRLLDAASAGGIPVHMAAPTLAEMGRGAGGLTAAPFDVVPFTRRAAECCAATMPETLLRDVRRYMGLREHYIKYDALIVGCALARGVHAVVTLDVGMHALCAEAGMRCCDPRQMLDALVAPTRARQGAPVAE